MECCFRHRLHTGFAPDSFSTWWSQTLHNVSGAKKNHGHALSETYVLIDIAWLWSDKDYVCMSWEPSKFWSAVRNVPLICWQTSLRFWQALCSASVAVICPAAEHGHMHHGKDDICNYAEAELHSSNKNLPVVWTRMLTKASAGWGMLYPQKATCGLQTKSTARWRPWPQERS